ncbi:Lysophospholipase L1 [Agromyces sp. CF514]|uniref:SGNH/GDSL hydrolase family protein n=1 Tax=Agromyces sp. CF514 TaxID=1881031 RepID=UPI0008EFF6DE|nr:SGNH/GDSL hydrolase family protein [Agromyces sp. CF514]SFR82873.1 Lysophospholipase L1 [Agromyces sp. CF514]
MPTAREQRWISRLRWPTLAATGVLTCAALVAVPVALASNSADPGTFENPGASERPTPTALPSETVAPTASPIRPTLAGLPVTPRALFVGDSFTEGYGTKKPAANWARIAAASLGWQATLDGVGGTGYIKDVSTDKRTGRSFVQRIPGLAESGVDYDVVVLQGGLNDIAADSTAEYTAVRKTIDSVRAHWPGAVIVVFGPAEPLGGGTSHLVHLSTIRQAAEASGVVFVDPSSPLAWITASNTDLLDLGDGLHLNDSGYAYLAARFVADIQAASATEQPVD